MLNCVENRDPTLIAHSFVKLYEVETNINTVKPNSMEERVNSIEKLYRYRYKNNPAISIPVLVPTMHNTYKFSLDIRIISL